jgi:hypothetical protein
MPRRPVIALPMPSSARRSSYARLARGASRGGRRHARAHPVEEAVEPEFEPLVTTRGTDERQSELVIVIAGLLGPL